MRMPNKICRVLLQNAELVREDGLPWPAFRSIYADPSGDPNEPWLWDGPNPSDPDPLPPPAPADA